MPHHTQWPAVRSARDLDPAVESRVGEILGRMTLEEKIGQMIQPELAQLTPQDVTAFKIGSALNGAGIWPGGARHAGRQEWIRTIDGFWEAAEKAYAGRGFRIPFAWATDAVHGNNNVFGATIFPHNIGLGAARDPDLIRRIGAATAREIAASGMDWTFAPTVTVPRDRRWGRYYEGYAEDPEVVWEYAPAMVSGIQGPAGDPSGVLACIKHWVADGGTRYGGDRGNAYCPEDLLLNIHAAGFLSGIRAGAQSVMVSFSSWVDEANYDQDPDGPAYNHKVHGSRYLITDVLKRRVGFDGIVISDWDAHAEVAGCTEGDARYAITAGIDVLMVAGRDAWQSVHRTTAEHVRAGRIPAERVDDAVRRVLRVKMRAGLWDRPRPAERRGLEGVIGAPGHRALAREAVRESLVLLKHRAGVLPLPRTARVLVTGSGADDIRKQAGGWTLTWQGSDVTLADLPGATTVATAVADVVGADRCTVDPALASADPAAHDVALVVIGEDSYAEMRGTIKPWGTLAYAGLKRAYAADLEILRRLRAAGSTVVTVFLGGRPLYVTEEINLSDAFVAAWLPGTEAGGITDVLFRDEDGGAGHDFRGRLGFSWPRTARSHAANGVPAHIPDYRVPPEEQAPEGEHAPLLPYGHGLRFADTGPAQDPLPVDTYRDPAPVPAAGGDLDITAGDGPDTFRLRIGGHNTWSRPFVSREGTSRTLVLVTTPVAGPDGSGALALEFTGYPSFLYAQYADEQPRDLRGYEQGSVVFLVRVDRAPQGPLLLACHDDHPAQPGLDISALIAGAPRGRWTRIAVPVADLRRAGMGLRHVDVPFMLYTESTARLDVAGIRWEPRGA